MAKVAKVKDKKEKPALDGSEVQYMESRLPPLFGKLLAMRQQAKDEIKAKEEQVKKWTEELTKMMREKKIAKVRNIDGFQIYRAVGSSTKLDKAKLLQFCTAAEIESCTDVNYYEYTQVIKEGNGEGDDE